MFPQAQDGLNRRPHLFSLPMLHNHPGSLMSSERSDEMRPHYDSQTPPATPDNQCYRPLEDRPRGKSFEDGVFLRAKLPGVASLMPSRRQIQEHQSQHEHTSNSSIANQQQYFSDELTERRRAQTLPQTTLPTMASSMSMERDLASPSLLGLSGFADHHFHRSNRYAGTPSSHSSRWSPYSSMSPNRYITSDSIAIPWGIFENKGAPQHHRRRRTSPRRRLAASKLCAQAMQFESDQVEYRFMERNYDAPALLLVPQIPVSLELSVPMALHPASPHLVDDNVTSSSKTSSTDLSEMNRRLILASLERGEKQRVLAEEFRATRAPIRNLSKKHNLVLPRLGKHPKTWRCKQESDYYTKDERILLRDGAQLICRPQGGFATSRTSHPDEQ